MAPNPLASALAGASFGAALTAAGVYAPSVIIGQFQLKDFLMLKVFLTGVAGGTLVMLAARRSNIAPCKPRQPISWNLFSSYDGNIIGGLVLGAGMALTGSCPGTVFVQLANGIPSSLQIAAGSLIGGVLFVAIQQRKSSTAAPAAPVYQAANTKESTAAVILTQIYVLVVLLAGAFLPSTENALLFPVLGGLAIVGSQATSLILTGNALGVSTAYEQVGQLFWWAVGGARGKRPAINSTVFAAGIAAGSWVLSRVVELPLLNEEAIDTTRAVIGGIFLTFGSRVAGGCTSGHGVSGMASLGIASFITAASMFGGGVLTGLLFR